MNKKQIAFLLLRGFKERKDPRGIKEWFLQKNLRGEVVITENGAVLFHFYKECYQDFVSVDSIADTLDYYKTKLDEIELGE